DAQAPRQPRPVDRTGATERHARQMPGILAPSDRHDADGAFHVEGDELMDAPCRVDPADAQGTRDVIVDRAGCRVPVEPARTSEEEIWVEVSQHEVRVGDGRLATRRP